MALKHFDGLFRVRLYPVQGAPFTCSDRFSGGRAPFPGGEVLVPQEQNAAAKSVTQSAGEQKQEEGRQAGQGGYLQGDGEGVQGTLLAQRVRVVGAHHEGDSGGQSPQGRQRDAQGQCRSLRHRGGSGRRSLRRRTCGRREQQWQLATGAQEYRWDVEHAKGRGAVHQRMPAIGVGGAQAQL